MLSHAITSVTQVYEAIYANGVFRPTTKITLKEGRRVRLVIESEENSTLIRDAYLATLPNKRANLRPTTTIAKFPDKS